MPQLKIRCRDAEISADVDSIEIGHVRILTSGGSLSRSIRAFLPVLETSAPGVAFQSFDGLA
jgi:hypothetical protein